MNQPTVRCAALATPILTALFLAACGGGGDAGSVSAADEQADEARATALAVAPTVTWKRIANEHGSFTVSGTQTVRYGVGTRWLEKTFAGTGQCTNAFFGRDPAVGVRKVCDLKVVTAPAPTPPTATFGNFRGASLGANANLNGAVAFPSDNAWNTDISKAARDPNSDALIASIGLSTGLKNDFGAGLWNGSPIGIPYVVVAGTQPKVTMTWTAYGDESDPGPYPIPGTAPIEGGAASAGDRHVLVIDRDANRLYEAGNAYPNPNGSWKASGGALFHLDSNVVRPGGQPGWTSADAAGLPIFPGLARYEEAARGPGGIQHALRFTVQRSRRAYVPPATHWASSSTDVNLPPMGMRVRLKASYVIPSTFSTETKALLTAMQRYGMFVADNGSNWYISGAPDERWNNDRLRTELAQVTGSQFEVVRMDLLVKP